MKRIGARQASIESVPGELLRMISPNEAAFSALMSTNRLFRASCGGLITCLISRASEALLKFPRMATVKSLVVVGGGVFPGWMQWVARGITCLFFGEEDEEDDEDDDGGDDKDAALAVELTEYRHAIGIGGDIRVMNGASSNDKIWRVEYVE